MRRSHVPLLLASVPLAVLLVPEVRAQERPVRAGVVVVGPDAARAGELQDGIESALVEQGGDSLVVVPASDFARRVASRSAQALPDDGGRAAELVEEGRRKFFAGNPSEALELLGSAAAMTNAPAKQRIRAHLHRAAVFQSQDNQAAIDAELSSVLRLDPEASADLGEFSPAIRDLLESLKRFTRKFTLRVAGVPPGAQATVDERPLTPDRTITVTAGEHVLAVQAPGFKRVTKSIDVSADTEVAAPSLPIALSTAHESSLSALAGRRAVSDPRIAEKLTARARIDAVVIVSTFGASVEALVSRGGREESRSFDAAQPAAIAEWAAGALRRLRPTPGGPLAGPQRTLSAGWAALAWSRSVQGEQRDPVSLDIGGTGLHVSGLAAGERVAGSFEFVGATFAVSSVSAALPAGGQATGPGGGYLRARFRGAYGVSRSAAWDVWLWAGLDGEHYASPARLASLELPLFVSWVSAAPVTGAELQWRPTPTLSATAELSLSPVGAYVEQPGGVTGRASSIAPSPGARIGVRWAASSRWRVDAGWWFERREVRFQGRSTTDFEESMSDARLTELRQTFFVSAGQAF